MVTERGMGESGAPKETVSTEVKRFSPETRLALMNEGYVVYTLSGQSIRSLRESGRPFFSTWHRDSQYEGFETRGSMRSEIAVDPHVLIIPGSNNKTISQQERMIAEFAVELRRKIEGVDAIMGEVADYAELAFAHLDATGERFFGMKYDFKYVRTKTPTTDSKAATIGAFIADLGLELISADPSANNFSELFATPMVIPEV